MVKCLHSLPHSRPKQAELVAQDFAEMPPAEAPATDFFAGTSANTTGDNPRPSIHIDKKYIYPSIRNSRIEHARCSGQSSIGKSCRRRRQPSSYAQDCGLLTDSFWSRKVVSSAFLRSVLDSIDAGCSDKVPFEGWLISQSPDD